MRVPGYRHPTLGKGGMKELPVTALLTAKHPSLLLKSLQNLPNFHERIVPLAVLVVNTSNVKLSDCRRKRALAANSALKKTPEHRN
jgi:hypothetical protein